MHGWWHCCREYFFLFMRRLHSNRPPRSQVLYLTAGTANGPAAQALFDEPAGLADGCRWQSLYRRQPESHDSQAFIGCMVTTFAGRAGHQGSANGSGTNAFSNPSDVALASNGTLYISDTGNNTIRSISTNGVVATLAGMAGQSGTTNGKAALQDLVAAGYCGRSWRRDIVADSGNHPIRKINSCGCGCDICGFTDRLGKCRWDGRCGRFNCPAGLAVDNNSNIFVSDANNYTIRKITPTGAVSTWAGLAGNEGAADGMGILARFGKPAD